jgi:2-polyprenyl-3-methyl-5-hydroxy-6-metoxy-1,4-benzoquinol methylase
MICTICESSSTNIKFTITGKHQLVSCNNCGIAFLHPQLSDMELKNLYTENYYKAWGISGDKENVTTKAMKMATFELRWKLIRQYASAGKILDVGCATGYFLELAKNKNFQPFGVEFSEYSANIAQKKFGEKNIFCGTLEQAPFAPNSFDAIAMSDLIEHVRNPIVTLSKAASLLKDDGIIMIMTPNSQSVSHYFMGKRWTHYKLEHFFYFNKKSIRYIAKKVGLDLVHYEKSKKALTINYLHTQFGVYKHWLLSPLLNLFHRILPEKIRKKNFDFSIGEMVVILKNVKIE